MSTAGKGEAEDRKPPKDNEKKNPSTTTKPTQGVSQTQMRTSSLAAQSPIPHELHTESQTEAASLPHPSSIPASSSPPPRQVIAVSASKNPAAFFNLARRFLVTDEYCDLSALEGAIVSAVDAAHLLERSKLANIVRYVVV